MIAPEDAHATLQALVEALPELGPTELSDDTTTLRFLPSEMYVIYFRSDSTFSVGVYGEGDSFRHIVHNIGDLLTLMATVIEYAKL